MFISDVTSQYANVTPTLSRHIFHVTGSVMDGSSTTSVLRQFIFKIKKFGNDLIKSHIFILLSIYYFVMTNILMHWLKPKVLVYLLRLFIS